VIGGKSDPARQRPPQNSLYASMRRLCPVVGELEHDALLVRLDAGVDVRLPITHMVSPGL
jgi:hypothetical protein